MKAAQAMKADEKEGEIIHQLSLIRKESADIKEAMKSKDKTSEEESYKVITQLHGVGLSTNEAGNDEMGGPSSASPAQAQSSEKNEELSEGWSANKITTAEMRRAGKSTSNNKIIIMSNVGNQASAEENVNYHVKTNFSEQGRTILLDKSGAYFVEMPPDEDEDQENGTEVQKMEDNLATKLAMEIKVGLSLKRGREDLPNLLLSDQEWNTDQVARGEKRIRRVELDVHTQDDQNEEADDQMQGVNHTMAEEAGLTMPPTQP
ncbi:hypothetical protein PIB30_075161 [Stylosanthes scabra]|uniref:Uncharacterized protein n=1 Tax=Stylosanthes scabra TaxID=79078 RepID=A0ABU6UTK3_9FABA|nr:hypothetical protein [Stylosanthes scabra]